MFENKSYELYKGDCLEVMDELIEQGVKVDCILTDPPYGTTACKWDRIIPFDEMWDKLNRLIKHNGAVVLFGSEPFSSHLRMSNIKNYKYDWIWEKSTSAGFVHAKNMPMKRHEIISVFSNAKMGHASQLGDNRMYYNPQGLKDVDKIHSRPNISMVNIIGARPSNKKSFPVKKEGYPTSILKFPNSNNKNVHRTQKPVDLLEYLINTYTNENEIVLDFTMGSGSTGVACMNTNRKFIGIELDDNYFDIAKNRIEDAYNQIDIIEK